VGTGQGRDNVMLVSRGSLRGRDSSIKLEGVPPDVILEREWLLTNSRGGFASGTVGGCNTRRYHGLLAGSLNPPANRVMALSLCREIVRIRGVEVDLGTYEFDRLEALNGLRFAVSFRKDTGVHFHYDLGVIELTKSIYLLGETDTTAVVYTFSNVSEQFEFEVRPFIALRDFHSLQKSSTHLLSEWRQDGLAVWSEADRTEELFLASDQMWFESDPQWWHNFLYRQEQRRGLDYLEDLWSPGVFKCNGESLFSMVLWAGLAPCGEAHLNIDVDLDIALESLSLRDAEIIGEQKPRDPMLEALYRAAGQFVVERQIAGKDSHTILAGFPWFLDWGRDTFIAFEGLLLCTGRFSEAADVLETFAAAVSEGMIPNRFDDYDNEPHYNSIDASLWFVHSAFAYLRATGDRERFDRRLIGAVRRIVEAYYKGTRFGIHADSDGLITGGDAETQLTWMDAKYDGVAFTPRHGKAVEVNALWYEALCNLVEYYNDTDSTEAEHFRGLVYQVSYSFRNAFWNEETGCLNDCILPDGTCDATLRPNQIYAVSLRHSALSAEQQRQVVEKVKSELLTPFGLRSLSRDDERYVGRYEGDQLQRDRAYHNGTVWSHLMGAFIEAFLRVNPDNRASRQEAFEMLQPLLNHFTESGCVESISEIFDGDEPHTPRGCIAQAWSVAEVLRAYKLVTTSQPVFGSNTN